MCTSVWYLPGFHHQVNQVMRGNQAKCVFMVLPLPQGCDMYQGALHVMLHSYELWSYEDKVEETKLPALSKHIDRGQTSLYCIGLGHFSVSII